jgi:hypothetical protein
VVPEEGQPGFARITPPTNSPEIPGHTSFRTTKPSF